MQIGKTALRCAGFRSDDQAFDNSRIEMGQSIEPLLHGDQVAAMLKVSADTVAAWRHTSRVKLPFVRVGGRIVRYKRSDVQAFIDAGYQPAAEGA